MQKHKLRGLLVLTIIAVTVMVMSFGTASAQTGFLSSTKGTSTYTWYISGESSLVMNLFDLNQFGLRPPLTIDSVTVSIAKFIPDTPVDVVIYSDKDGGSPSNAILSRRQTIPSLTQAGEVQIPLTAPVTVGDRYIWVGLYMPVGFEFLGDRQGTSSLTWWAWTPNSTFDLNNLSSAQVLGPANGTDPVKIDMKGAARIGIRVSYSATSVLTGTPVGTPSAPIQQIPGEAGVNLSPMVTYTGCPAVLYDSADVNVTYKSGITVYCRLIDRDLNYPNPSGYQRRGALFDFYLFGVPSGIQPLPYAITHCIRPNANQIEGAVMGVAHGSPRAWQVLPTVRYGDLICAEVPYAGYLSVFQPR